MVTPINFSGRSYNNQKLFLSSFVFFVRLLDLVVSLETLAMQAGKYKSHVLTAIKTVIFDLFLSETFIADVD